jgi:hypothetical protein
MRGTESSFVHLQTAVAQQQQSLDLELRLALRRPLSKVNSLTSNSLMLSADFDWSFYSNSNACHFTDAIWQHNSDDNNKRSFGEFRSSWRFNGNADSSDAEHSLQ